MVPVIGAARQHRFRTPKKKAFEKACPDPLETARKERWPLLAFNGSLPTTWTRDLPAFLPAKFLYRGSSELAPDVCCPGSSCISAKQVFRRCQCSDINNPEVNDKLDVSFTACGDPTGGCSTISWSDDWCNFPNVDGTTFRISCRIPLVLSCLDYAPSPPPAPSPTASPSASPPSATPTPTPSPEPTCDPATKPNNTNCICDTTPYTIAGAPPQWQCGIGCNGATGADYRQFQSNGGCPSNKYNDGTTAVAVLFKPVPTDRPQMSPLVSVYHPHQRPKCQAAAETPSITTTARITIGFGTFLSMVVRRGISPAESITPAVGDAPNRN